MKLASFSLFATICAILALSHSGAAQSAAKIQPQLPATCYVFSYFINNGEDGLHLAWSRDGLQWDALNGGQSVLTPTVGNSKLMRDPCITRGPDGMFHMVWTDSWESQTIGYASSPDLIHWSQQKALKVMQHEPTTRNCWAPEISYDAQRKQFLIFWASTIPDRFPETEFEGKNDNNHRIYATTTRNFKAFTPTKLFFNPGFNVIDSTLLKSKDQVLMFFKDETKFPQAKKNLHLAIAEDYAGPFAIQPQAITPVGDWVEGPTALKIGDYTYLYFDVYTRHRYDALRSRDFQSWENVSAQLVLPQGVRHGTAIPVSAKTMQRLLDRDNS